MRFRMGPNHEKAIKTNGFSSFFACQNGPKMTPNFFARTSFLATFFGHRFWKTLLAHIWLPFGSIFVHLGSLSALLGSLSSPFSFFVGSLFAPFGSFLAPIMFLWLPFGDSLAPAARFQDFCCVFCLFPVMLHEFPMIFFLKLHSPCT